MNEIFKAQVDIGGTVTRPDGTVWRRTSMYGYEKVKDGDKPTADKPKGDTKKPDGKPTMTAEEADKLIQERGEKGVYAMTAAGMNAYIEANGHTVDPKMLYVDKVKLVQKIHGEKESKEKEKTIEKLPIHKPMTNKNLTVRLEDFKMFDKDDNPTKATPETAKDLIMEAAHPEKGDHWGSADSTNTTALGLAYMCGTKYRPIDKIKNGELQEYDREISSSVAFGGAGRYKYAQEQIKKFPKEEFPNIYRGMSIDSDQLKSIVDGKTDTIELTGCTAMSFYEKIADRYSKSAWTARVGGKGKQSIKLVIERDDGLDSTVGMWHHSRSGVDKPAFEILSGAESLKIDKVKSSGETYEEKMTKLKNKVDKIKKSDPNFNIEDEGTHQAAANSNGYMDAINNWDIISKKATSFRELKEIADRRHKTGRIVDRWEEERYKNTFQNENALKGIKYLDETEFRKPKYKNKNLKEKIDIFKKKFNTHRDLMYDDVKIRNYEKYKKLNNMSDEEKSKMIAPARDSLIKDVNDHFKKEGINMKFDANSFSNEDNTNKTINGLKQILSKHKNNSLSTITQQNYMVLAQILSCSNSYDKVINHPYLSGDLMGGKATDIINAIKKNFRNQIAEHTGIPTNVYSQIIDDEDKCKSKMITIVHCRAGKGKKSISDTESESIKTEEEVKKSLYQILSKRYIYESN